ncbi:16S rRNA (uracil(1498)-N(3))-methyltransferase [Demequina mangrovi]|uniref:Ribosomal RNA small subunit methyltransferase E n=1 Tax=Demequina mangrovi TaxID=1043493 RepID=A0A1H6V703_9MICO|nr:16S rRNA (uracil(1498)-N(3))-methyltransferase [Demequina mangrovi]SEI96035.1 16S rRNA (uracil1498-N3)-methyltransferase [Demequina mangrovi]
MTAPVFVDPAAATAAAGGVLRVEGDEARHAVTVQRRQAGERIDVVDGAGARASGVLVASGDRWMEVRIEAVSRDLDPDSTLVQALAKGGRDEQAVEAAVELGVTRIVPWASDRAIVQWRGPKAAKGREKWSSLALAAAKQSRRALVPSVDDAATTKQLAARVREAVDAGARVLVLHEAATAALADLAWADPDQPVWMIVGPEGGISDAELDALTAAGAIAVVLGPHVLRASSAGPAALAALGALRGHWSRPGAAS